MELKLFAFYSGDVKFELCINNEWFEYTRAEILEDADLGTRYVHYWSISKIDEGLVYATLGPSDSELAAV